MILRVSSGDSGLLKYFSCSSAMPWIRDECMNLSKKEIKELVELDARCFDPPINYSSRDIKFYTLHPEAILLREYEKKTLIAYCLGNAKDGNIITIDVHPLYRRRGLGRRLLVQMLREFRARNIAQAISQIALDNLPSIQLHQSLGFQIRHILYGYYPDGTAAYELVLPLSPIKS